MMTLNRVAQAQRNAAVADLERLRPRTPGELDRFVRRVLGLAVPRRPLVEGNDAPFAYLVHAFFEPGSETSRHGQVRALEEGSGDLVVWANRGGGKTMLGAVATVLDLLFKPGVQVRILGGSMAQSSRMFEHLLRFVDRPALRPLLALPPTRTRLVLINGSRADILAQSQRSIRGVRVHKLRCDEVEMFRPEVWQAAQLTTRSGRCGPVAVRGRVEAMSTLHEVGGLMSQLIDRPGTRVLRWSALDVAQRCAPQRSCDGCPLWKDCRGLAKRASGFIPIQDLIDQWHRTSDATWDAEMMCRRPSTEHQVYPRFDPQPGGRHVGETVHRGSPLVAGLDFGLRNPLVMLWARYTPLPAGPSAARDDQAGALRCASRLSGDRGLLEIIDEHHEKDLTLDQHLHLIERHGLPRPMWIAVDPAGNARNSQTGMSDVQYLRHRGYRVRLPRMPVRHGLDLVRRRLDRGTLRIHPRCTNLIRALSTYRYPADRPDAENPLKDGPDHACDALRYLVVALEHTAPVEVRTY